MDRKGDLLAGIVIGSIVGFGIGLLFAPASGEETRQRLREAAGDAAEQACERSRDLVKQARLSAEEMAAKAREGALDTINKLRERLPMAGDQAEEILDELESEIEARA